MIVAKAGKLAYKLLQGREVCGTAFPVKNCTYVVCESGQVIAIYERGPSLPFGIRANVRPQGSVSMCASEIVWENGKAEWQLEEEQIAEYEVFDAEKSAAAVCSALRGEAKTFSDSIGERLKEGAQVLAEALIGRGRGLTPSGDDALVGVMYAARKTGKEFPLAHEVLARLHKTSAVSAAFLEAAATGETFSAVEEVFGADPFSAAQKLSGYGSESGQAVLAGMAAFFTYSKENGDEYEQRIL